MVNVELTIENNIELSENIIKTGFLALNLQFTEELVKSNQHKQEV